MERNCAKAKTIKQSISCVLRVVRNSSSLLIFSVFLVLDMRRRTKKIKLENAKLKIYKAMLSSSHHILNNFIYQMDIFKITAEDTPGFDAKILAFYEDIISNTSDQIYSLSNLSHIDEYSIRTSVMTG